MVSCRGCRPKTLFQEFFTKRKLKKIPLFRIWKLLNPILISNTICFHKTLLLMGTVHCSGLNDDIRLKYINIYGLKKHIFKTSISSF